LLKEGDRRHVEKRAEVFRYPRAGRSLPRGGSFELVFTAVVLQGLVHENAIVIRVQRAQANGS
jgi:hypothetical protein